MDAFVARQPIFNRHKKIYAYELLFRTGETNGFPDIDGETATTSLLSSSFFTVGIDKIGAGKLVFINFTEDLLLKGSPSLFPPQKMVVEVLEDVVPTPNIINACQELKEQGYLLALDDFVYSKQFDELLELADIVKVDFLLTPIDQVETMIKALEPYGCKLLAEKVETYEEYQKAIDLGFEYFQGYFFSKPEILRNKDFSSSQLNVINIISEMNCAKELDVETLEKLVAVDISMTYKLLNYINSAHFGRVQPVKSIQQAISFLGFNEFRRFVTLIGTSLLGKDKPNELMRISIIRARFLELVGIEVGANSSELFLVGLFSSIDAILDQSIQTIMKKISVSETINKALVERTGDLFVFLRLIETYESGNWVACKFAQKKVGLTGAQLSHCYIEALSWADSYGIE